MTIELLPLVSVFHPTNVASTVDGSHEPVLFDWFPSKIDAQLNFVSDAFMDSHDGGPHLVCVWLFVVAVHPNDSIQIARDPLHFAEAVAVEWIEVKSVHAKGERMCQLAREKKVYTPSRVFET